MWNDQVQRSPKYLTMTANLSYFHLDLNAVIAYLAWARFQTRAEQIPDNITYSLVNYKFIFD